MCCINFRLFSLFVNTVCYSPQCANLWNPLTWLRGAEFVKLKLEIGETLEASFAEFYINTENLPNEKIILWRQNSSSCFALKTLRICGDSRPNPTMSCLTLCSLVAVSNITRSFLLCFLFPLWNLYAWNPKYPRCEISKGKQRPSFTLSSVHLPTAR